MLDVLTRQSDTYTLEDRDLVFAEPQAGYVLRVRDLPDTERPRERLLELGPGNLSVAELIAIVWGVGTAKEDVLAMARRTLKEYGEKVVSNELDPRRLEGTDADIRITLAAAGDVLGIELLDHLIITATRYTSLMDCISRA